MKRNYLSILLVTLSWIFTFMIPLAAQNTAMPLKLKVGTYNVGHFNQGRLGGFQGEGRIIQAELNRWKKWIGDQSLDILGLNEWNRHFDKDSGFMATEELLQPFYDYIHFGTENTWIYNGFATNFEITNLREKTWAGQYYALIGEFRTGNKTVHLISTHLPWQKEWHNQAVKDLIEYLGGLGSFICMGDMNARDENQLLFTEAGFNMANGGNLGWFPTSAQATAATGYTGKENVNIDNIITSSDIKIMNVKVPETGLNDLDHFPVIADVIITP